MAVQNFRPELPDAGFGAISAPKLVDFILDLFFWNENIVSVAG